MWDCKHRTVDDQCKRRKDECYPGGLGCVLKGKFAFPFREKPDPLVEKLARRKSRKKVQKW